MIRAIAGIWTSPNTALGLITGLLGFGLPRPGYGAINFYLRRGLVHAIARSMGISAFTLGDCIIYLVEPTRNLRVHELRHVTQYHALGPLFLPSYFLMLAFFGYNDHPLEVDAYEHERNACGSVGESGIG
jgi:hypothetical protein